MFSGKQLSVVSPKRVYIDFHTSEIDAIDSIKGAGLLFNGPAPFNSPRCTEVPAGARFLN